MENQKTTFRIQIVLVVLALVLMACACVSSFASMLSFYLGDFGSSSSPLDEQATLLRTIGWTLDMKLYYFTGAALVISSLAAFFGWKSYKDLDDVIQEKIRATLENELYQLDPANLTVRLPKTHPDREKIENRLRAAGLKNLKTYTELSDRCKIGLTIVPVENEEQEKDFVAFLEREQPEVNHAAFVLYVPSGYRLSQDAINKHDRAATANMPSTVVTAILAISRGLHHDHVLTEKKEGA